MISNTDRLIEIIEDHASYEIALRSIILAAETRELPPEGILPTFNDSMATDNLKTTLELVTGKKY